MGCIYGKLALSSSPGTQEALNQGSPYRFICGAEHGFCKCDDFISFLQQQPVLAARKPEPSTSRLLPILVLGALTLRI